MSMYNIILARDESTVVAEYEPSKDRPQYYQSEAMLEKEFIKQLVSQGYTYPNIKCEEDLIPNLRLQLEKLNNINFTQAEWDYLYTSIIANKNEGVVDKTHKIQQDYIHPLLREDGSLVNVKLIDVKNVHSNSLQVINQYAENNGTHKSRYDVTILVNGLPLVHVELKRRGMPLREAFNQIKRYQNNSFWAADGLFQYVQIFVISNGTNTKYYSNTTRLNHVNPRKNKKTSKSFSFTSFWADARNKTIYDIVDFTKTFFAKHTILNILTHYCIFTVEKDLLVMRPYQIIATERIIEKIKSAYQYKQAGTLKAGGYIWHTTGSGKTLTSFKTAQLATDLAFIKKVLFVVDRKDLDVQTMREYNKFQEGAANSNKSARVLQKQLENPDAKIIVTTIQKLDVFVSKNKYHDIYNENVVIIFDECHRSQFGDMHQKIIKHFKKYYLFGFTGTPIFVVNAKKGGNPNARTTQQVFGDALHKYTIVEAINDKNVLPFRASYVNTMKAKDGIKDIDVQAINKPEALEDPRRIANVVEYILENFNRQTKRNEGEDIISQRFKGFNSMFAVQSIKMARLYYNEFKKQNNKLNIATVFSYAPNGDDNDDGLFDEEYDNRGLSGSDRDFLDEVVKEYNDKFNTNFDTSGNFENYCKNVDQRVKNKEIDILIVVNMFLTGFDAPNLNTLWVDKNLKHHGLIQAFSRTNRILNSVKTYGNIICFRNLDKEIDDALAIFGDKEAVSVALLNNYDFYYNGGDKNGTHQTGYIQLIDELTNLYPIHVEIIGEQNKKKFIALFGSILRLKNVLSAFDEFVGNEILSPRDFQDYQSIYIDLYREMRPYKPDQEYINDDIIFEMELIKQVEINIDYILMLVAEYRKKNGKDKEILVTINKAIDATVSLRSKKELINNFIMDTNIVGDTVQSQWQNYISEEKEKELETLISEENLKEVETKKLIDNSFRDGSLKTTGTAIDKILPPMSRFSGKRAEKKQSIIQKLLNFFEKYF